MSGSLDMEKLEFAYGIAAGTAGHGNTISVPGVAAVVEETGRQLADRLHAEWYNGNAPESWCGAADSVREWTGAE